MTVLKAHFDGESICLPPEVRRMPPGEVIVVFSDGATPDADAQAWLKAQEDAFRKVWDNDDDAVYDSL